MAGPSTMKRKLIAGGFASFAVVVGCLLVFFAGGKLHSSLNQREALTELFELSEPENWFFWVNYQGSGVFVLAPNKPSRSWWFHLNNKVTGVELPFRRKCLSRVVELSNSLELEQLKFIDGEITDSDLHELARLDIEELVLCRTIITPANFQRLKTILPNTEIQISNRPTGPPSGPRVVD